MGRRDIVSEREDGYCQDETTPVFGDDNAMISDTTKAMNEI